MRDTCSAKSTRYRSYAKTYEFDSFLRYDEKYTHFTDNMSLVADVISETMFTKHIRVSAHVI